MPSRKLQNASKKPKHRLIHRIGAEIRRYATAVSEDQLTQAYLGRRA